MIYALRRKIIVILAPEKNLLSISNADCYMKKTSFIIALLLCFAAGATADPVTKSAAQQAAESFMAKRGMKNSNGLSLTYQARPTSSRRKTAPSANAFYYVFNNSEQGGFVIVSGDDATEQILGYSDSGTFDSENIPASMQELLDGYKQEISYAREKGLNKSRSAASGELDEPARQVIAPLISSVWNQRTPYNLQCFTTDGQQAVTGCVATALAQVMYYHKWPQSATTAIPAYKTYNALPATTFDWGNMQPTYTEYGAESDAQKNAVATLNVYCGHAVQMGYGTGTSSASSSRIPNALKNYFGYANDATEIYRSDCTPAEWDERIYHELLHQRPVIYSASTSSGSGHAFICDGYDGNGLYHINWGWGGLSDGYFRLQALNPNSQGTGGSSGNGGYSLYQSAIVGISPTVVDDAFESGDEEEVPISGIENSNFSLVDSNLNELESGEMTDNYSFQWGFHNVSIAYSFRQINDENAYDVGLGLFQNEELVDVFTIFTNLNDPGSTYSLTASLNGFGTNLADGTYVMKGIDRPTGTDEWNPSIGSDHHYITVDISNGILTAKKVVIPEEEKVKQIELVKVEQDRCSANQMKLNAYVKNTGEVNYDGILYLYCDGNPVAYEGIYLAPGDEDYVTFAFSATVGNHQIEIAGSGSNPLYSGNLTLEGLPEIPELTKVSEEVKNLVDGNIYGTLFEGSVTLKNATTTDYNNYLKIQLLKSKGDLKPGYYAIYDELKSVSIPAGATFTLPISCQAAIGDEIIVRVSESTDDNTRYYNQGAYTVKAGIVTWTADGQRTVRTPTSDITVGDNVVAIELDEIPLTDVTVTPNSNPNTLYIIGANATTPVALSGKNVVKGYKAANIVLQDGYNFFFPRTVMVEGTTTYTRTLALACDGTKGWSTIALPFAVQQVTNADNQPIDWRHASDTSDNDFWLREFKGVCGGEVAFSDVEKWVANQPYVIGVPSDLKDKNLTFSATATKVMPTTTSTTVTTDYQFIGTSLDKTLANAYVMDNDGSAFVPTADATVKAGYAYFNVGAATQPDRIPISTGGIKGDVNGDGLIDIKDITLLVNYILGKTSDGIILENADMNEDSRYDVTDLTLICNAILGKL